MFTLNGWMVLLATIAGALGVILVLGTVLSAMNMAETPMTITLLINAVIWCNAAVKGAWLINDTTGNVR